jgi:thiamine-phosphate pyrophosphorylase
LALRLLAISDRRSFTGGALGEWAGAVAAAGVPAIQLREKDLADQALLTLARLVRAAAPRPTSLLVNGRADIALAADADGVHLPADGAPTAALRRRWGSRLVIGRSAHNKAEVAAAADEGADYVTFGPVFASPGKGPCTGLDGLAAVTGLGVPVFALGGVGVDRLGEVAAAGAAGAAGIRLFQDIDRLPEIVAAAAEVGAP